MKKLSVLIMLAFSMLFLACEDDVVPIPLPPPAQVVGNESAPPPPAEEKAETKPAAAAEKPSEPAKAAKAAAKEAPPVKVAKEPPPQKEPAKPAAYFSGDAEQLKTGRYIVQVGIYPTEASARKVIKKLSDDGIKAYNAKVDNPDPEKGMIGTYNRVRIGFFDAKSTAEAFAKSRLEPMGYRWWVDRSRNDNIGKIMDSESEPFVVEKRPVAPKQMSEQERKDAERAAAIAAAKEEYKAIAKAANASVNSAPALTPPKIPAKNNPPPPVIKDTDTESRVRVKAKSKREQ